MQPQQRLGVRSEVVDEQAGERRLPRERVQVGVVQHVLESRSVRGESDDEVRRVVDRHSRHTLSLEACDGRQQLLVVFRCFVMLWYRESSSI